MRALFSVSIVRSIRRSSVAIVRASVRPSCSWPSKSVAINCAAFDLANPSSARRLPIRAALAFVNPSASNFLACSSAVTTPATLKWFKMPAMGVPNKFLLLHRVSRASILPWRRASARIPASSASISSGDAVGPKKLFVSSCVRSALAAIPRGAGA